MYGIPSTRAYDGDSIVNNHQLAVNIDNLRRLQRILFIMMYYSKVLTHRFATNLSVSPQTVH